MRRAFALAAAVAAAVLAPASASAASPLVLGKGDLPGLRAARTTPRAALVAVARAVRPARLPAARRAERTATRFTGQGAQLWSLSLVHRNRAAARATFARWTRALRRVRAAPAGVGEGSRAILGRQKTFVVVWRRGTVLSALALRGPLAAGRLRIVALRYARYLDVRVKRELAKTAWERTLDEVLPNGRVKKSTALKLFALAYRALPGTARPSGPRDRRVDATIAGRAVLRVWRTLTPAQRTVARRALGFSTVPLGRRTRRVSAPSVAAPNYGDPNFRRNARLEAGLRFWGNALSKLLGVNRPLRFRIVGGTSTSVNPKEAFADAYPVTSNGTPSDAATYCRVRFVPTYASASGAFRELVLAHEMFHCWEFDLMGPSAALAAPDWLIEGGAEWAALAAVQPPFSAGHEWLTKYLGNNRRPLFSRTYDGVGFFGQHEEALGDLFPKMPAVLRAWVSGGDPAAYAAAGGDEPRLLDSWGSQMWNRPRVGGDWDVTRPIPYPADVSGDFTPLAWSRSDVSVEPFAVSHYLIDKGNYPASKPLLHFRIPPFARLGNVYGIDTTSLSDAWFCLKEECKCPEGTEGNPPPAPPLGSQFSFLALTGGRTGNAGLVTAVALEEYCKKKKDPPPPPGGGGGPIGGGGGPPGGGGGGPGGCGSGCGGSNGDPHLTTFDGRFYDHQAAGEFTLARSESGDLEVQAREEPLPGSPNLSINSAFAFRLGRDRVGVYRGSPLAVRVNGRGFLPRRRWEKLPRGGGWIREYFGNVEVWWPDGTVARVWPVEPWGVSTLIRPSPKRRGALRGLLGNFDGDDANDFVTRGGRRLPVTTPANYRLLYRVLGESWRIRQGQSLFDYSRGQSTKTFTNRRFPRKIVDTPDLPPDVRRRAERTCRRMGIRDPRILRDCILDVAASGDNRFATNAGRTQRTGGRFLRPTSPEERAVSFWTVLETNRFSNVTTPWVAAAGGKVVVALRTAEGSADAYTFTPSRLRDVARLRHHTLVRGWARIDDPVLLPRPGGGLQALIGGSHSTTTGDPLNATSLLVRNADGSWGAPTPLSAFRTDVGGYAVLAPDGAPLWASAQYGDLQLLRGPPSPAVSDLTGILPGTDYIPSLGKDGLGRYWIFWYELSRGLHAVEIDPRTLRPRAAVQRAPESTSPYNNSFKLALACARVCRVVYVDRAGERILSWAPGERRPALVARRAAGPYLAAAYTPGGRLWVAWLDRADNHYRAALGTAAGAGGRQIDLGLANNTGGGYGLSGVTVGNDLVLVAHRSRTQTSFARYVNVVAPPRAE